jgi:uncharacterized protein (DUF1697 family)
LSAKPASLPRFAALLRGINVGRAKRVAMADLRDLLTSIGYADVRTLLNSGNVTFSAETTDAAGHARRIRQAVADKLGVDAEVVAVSAADFASIVAENPLVRIATDSSRLLVAFAQEPTRLSALAGLAAADWAPDALAVGRRAAYVWCADGILQSKLALSVNRALGDSVTTRNWNTVEKIGLLLG